MIPVLSFSDLVIDRGTFYHYLVLLEITTVQLNDLHMYILETIQKNFLPKSLSNTKKFSKILGQGP